MIKLVKRIDRRSWYLIALVFFMVWAQVGLDLKIPAYMSEITELLSSGSADVKNVFNIGLIMLVIALISLAISIIVSHAVSYFTANFTKNIRNELYDKVQSLGLEEIHRFKTASLITRTTNDLNQIEMMLGMGVQAIFQAPIMAIWTMRRIATKNWQWSLATGIAIVALLTVIALLVIIVLPKFSLVQKLIDKINSVTRENLTGIRVIRAFNAEAYQEEKFDAANKDLTSTQLFNQRIFALLEPIIYLVMFLLSLSIFYIGAVIINGASPTERVGLFGDMVVFSAYAMQLIFSFLTMAFILIIVSRAQVSADRINEVLDTESSLVDGSLEFEETDDIKVEYDNVSFQFDDAEAPVLSGISFDAKNGETIGIIGSTGSGKSTLVNLLARFFDVTDGRILINNQDIRNYKMFSLNNILGYVSQKPVIFDMSVLDNVKYGSTSKGKVSNIDAREAIELAQAKDFVDRLEYDEHTRISRGGTNLSGGQKQRLSIARAIARKPKIFIFDDSFSALDNKTDLALRNALEGINDSSIKFIVATRIGTILKADKIIVLEEGKMVGFGKHEELLEDCEVYRQIALSQLTEEELSNETR